MKDSGVISNIKILTTDLRYRHTSFARWRCLWFERRPSAGSGNKLTKIKSLVGCDIHKNVKKNPDTVKAINYIDSSNLNLFFNSGTSILHPSIN